MTTLSACDSGRGEGRTSEGVLGLRRGFIQAGTQNLVMTLWPLIDNVEEIYQFEREFYQRAITTQNEPKALAETQRKWMIEVWESGGSDLPDSTGILDAVRLIGPFIMSFQGALGKE